MVDRFSMEHIYFYSSSNNSALLEYQNEQSNSMGPRPTKILHTV